VRTTTRQGGGRAFSPTHAAKATQDTKTMPVSGRIANTSGSYLARRIGVNDSWRTHPVLERRAEHPARGSPRDARPG
jgi:hypothetical protein